MVLAKPGDQVRAGDPILELHYRDRARLDAALPLANRSIALGDVPPAPTPLLVGEVH
jgi:thymidine phosphorylase